jgi:hypothetical protein
MSDYASDILTWSERQAELLRQHVGGTRSKTQRSTGPTSLRIAVVGQSQVDQVESWLFQMALHMLKAEAWPLLEAVPHRQAEARGFRRQARRRCRPSMAQKIDVPGLYADALYAMPETIDGQSPLPVRPACPVTLDELLGDEP